MDYVLGEDNPMVYADKCKEKGLRLEKQDLLKLSKRMMVMAMEEQDPEVLNSVYREISEKMGIEVAMELYEMFKGQQISFPVRFFNPSKLRQVIIKEYDGTNIRMLAQKYNYSEKTIRRILKKTEE